MTEGVEESVGLSLAREELTLLLSPEDAIRTHLELPESLQAPVEAGTTVGWQSYYVNDVLYAQLPITTRSAVDIITYRYCLEQILKEFLP